MLNILVFTSYQEPKGDGMMKHLWRLLTGRCTSCGQKLKSKQTGTERVSEINNKADLLAASFGRRPQVRSCEKCHRIVFEEELGFVQSLLLIDMDLDIYPKKQTVQHRLQSRRSAVPTASADKQIGHRRSQKVSPPITTNRD